MLSLLAILISTVVAVDDSRSTCIRASARVDFVDGDPISYAARSFEQQCRRSDSPCTAIKKVGLSHLQTMGDNTTNSTTRSRAWSSVDMGCSSEVACDRVLGDDSSSGVCRYARYSYTRYDPRSCDGTRDYDARRYTQAVRLFYGCCNDGDNCNQGAPQQMTKDRCTLNEELSSYIGGLHECWDSVKEAFRRYFICDSGGASIYEMREICSDAEYDRFDVESNCTYVRTCSSDLQELLRRFGVCACNKAKENDFSGATIAEYMETLYNRFCPDIEISCSGVQRALYLRRRRIRRRLKVRLARSGLTEEERAAIRRKIVQRVRCDDDVVEEVDYAESDSTRRRMVEETEGALITLDFNMDDESYADYLADAAGYNICDSTTLTEILGEDAVVESCEESEVYDDVYGSNSTDTTTETPSNSTEETPAPIENPSSASFVIIFMSIVTGFFAVSLQ